MSIIDFISDIGSIKEIITSGFGNTVNIISNLQTPDVEVLTIKKRGNLLARIQISYYPRGNKFNIIFFKNPNRDWINKYGYSKTMCPCFETKSLNVLERAFFDFF